ncbi:anti-sigma factor [Segetibacter sp. 3557_3]|uniref:anti-sigma factor n=1 Tax=Segetibacter sp. 3557_3 TaxID=2547429 RepID=UPI0010584A49|nr:anti-sigma factor [Segetibacter sp. 3557_3]TDH23053.1 anti-sigma factor [Segetibacter sp. 3557_3]
MDIRAYIQSGVIESYVLGIATDEEITEVNQLRLKYPEVQTAIDEFSHSLEHNAFHDAIMPPPSVKLNIMNTLAGEFNKSKDDRAIIVPLQDTSSQRLTQPPGYKVWQFAAAASIILLLTSAAFNIYLFNRYSDTSERYQALLSDRNTLQANNQVMQTKLHDWQAAVRMMADSNMNMFKMPGIEGKQDNMAMLFWDGRSKDVYVMANKLPAPIPGKQYQLWALVDGKPVDAGVLDMECPGVCKMKNIQRAQGFAITLENAGGSPTPTMSQMLVYTEV